MSGGWRLPALGPRGEGWVFAQVVLFVTIAISGLADLARRDRSSLWLAASVLGFAAIAAGLAVAAWGVWDLRASLSPFPRPTAGAALVQTGAYRLIRHPIYSGLVLGALGWGVVTGSALSTILAVALLVLFDLKSRREELWLAEVLPGYPAYRARTRRFIPWLY